MNEYRGPALGGCKSRAASRGAGERGSKKSQGELSAEEHMVLLTLDTDLVKNYVFATSKLREIRGASALLDEINERRIPEIIGPERVVYAGGGTALAELE